MDWGRYLPVEGLRTGFFVSVVGVYARVCGRGWRRTSRVVSQVPSTLEIEQGSLTGLELTK